MDAHEQEALSAIQAAMKDPDVSIKFPLTFTHGRAVQVHIKTRKIGPLLFPGEGQTVADVLHMLGTMQAQGD